MQPQSASEGVNNTASAAPSPVKSSLKKVAANLLILQGDADPLFSAPVWAEPSQSLIVMWDLGARKGGASGSGRAIE